jgi:hypothetical protein
MTIRMPEKPAAPVFSEITLADKAWLEPLFRQSGYNSEEFNFTFCYVWRDIFYYKAAKMNGLAVIGAFKENRPPTYLFPSGAGNIAPVVEALTAQARENGHGLLFHCVLKEHKALLETLFHGEFEFVELSDYYDYVYEAESLISLSGKKLHAKRNHIHRFTGNYPDWGFEAITPENMPEVLEMNARWCEENGCEGDKSLEQEICSVRNALRDYFSLGLDGGVLRAGGRVVAFSIGERLNFETYIVHIEKAFGDIQGAYAMVNQQFAGRYCKDYRYIDREDDSGNEGLRKAKQSYRPAFMVEKFAAKRL